jgi:hypothetical protein
MELNGRPLVTLPPVNVYVNKIAFGDPKERELYSQLFAESRKLFLESQREDAVMENYNHILAVLTNMRLCCDHHGLVKNFTVEGGELTDADKVCE